MAAMMLTMAMVPIVKDAETDSQYQTFEPIHVVFPFESAIFSGIVPQKSVRFWNSDDADCITSSLLEVKGQRTKKDHILWFAPIVFGLLYL